MDFRIWIISLAVISFLRLFNIGQLPPDKEIVISGAWLFTTGDMPDWKKSEYDDSNWATIEVPSVWENQGYADYNGIAWYRKHIEIPNSWQNVEGISFDIGKIDDEDSVYFNGRLIGSTIGWQRWRRYSIPLSLVRFGEDNVIAIMVNDTGGNGGIWEGPIKLVTGLTARFNVEEY